MIFVDTSAWFARFVADDPDHGRVAKWFEANDERLVTSDYCIDETLTLLIARKRPRLALQVGQQLLAQTICSIHFLTPDTFSRAWILFQQQAASGWSFTDCTSKVVIDELGIRAAVASDVHFRAFGIVVLP
ncbi:MAG TPA: PIN domain-containing protein [Pirellulales bacterium]|jgi:hypothetical protein|nr:PIN domain-containing protein [Pirellulales bacterium]